MDRNEALRLLELAPGYSQAELKEAYRDMLKVWHPDRFPSDSPLHARALERTKRINTAFSFLGKLEESERIKSTEALEDRGYRSQGHAQAPEPGDSGPVGPVLRTYSAKPSGLKNPRTVQVCEKGFVLHWRRRDREIVRWDRVEALRFSARQTKLYWVIPISNDRFFWIRLKGGGEILLSDGIKDVESLFQEISAATAAQHIAAAIADLENAREVDFGPVRLSLEGIHMGRKLLPWPLVADVTVHNGFIHVFATNKETSFASCHFGSTWNPVPLFRIVDRMKGAQG